ncbi:MAG TPA: Hpt domain-containing protein [Caulobacteraceae bacterium]|nr:Hpt domain-containing protein [Caulobacteraceae bacterium]
MSQQTQGQMIPVSNTLKLKLGSRFGGIDPAALAKAEAALKGLADNFDQWMQDELGKLDAARARIASEGYTAETAENLYFRAHDLKGLGATYGYPVVTQIAASLCRLIDEPATRMKAPLFLLDAHIDGIKAAVRGNIREADHAVAKSLLEELDRRVKDYEK